MPKTNYHRYELAELFVKRLLKQDIFTSRDGLFVAGLRGIGKTTFLRSDLIPHLKNTGAYTIYVDLSKSVEDGALSEVDHAQIKELFTNLITDKKEKTKKDEATRLGVGQKKSTTLYEVLFELISKIDLNIVIVIDEIQEALKNNSGRQFLDALKDARDAINRRERNVNHTYFVIVGVGSHRTLISNMVRKSGEPFFGADLSEFPHLEDDYIQWLVNSLQLKKVPDFQTLHRGFEAVQYRPTVFEKVLNRLQAFNGFEVNEAFLMLAQNALLDEAEILISPIKRADALTQALFTEIAKSSEAGCNALYSKDFLERLGVKLGKDKPMTASSVQAKLKMMELKGWITQVSHGRFSLTNPKSGILWLSERE